MARDEDSWADGVDTATPGAGGVYFLPGVYDVEILELKKGEQREGDYDYFAADFEIITSNNPQRPVGSKVGWFTKLKKEHPGIGNMRALLAVAWGCELEKIKKAEVLVAVSAQQPYAGKRLRVVATDISTKKLDHFTKCEWLPFGGAAQASAPAAAAR